MKQDHKTKLSFHALLNCLLPMDKSLENFEAILMTTVNENKI